MPLPNPWLPPGSERALATSFTRVAQDIEAEAAKLARGEHLAYANGRDERVSSPRLTEAQRKATLNAYKRDAKHAIDVENAIILRSNAQARRR